MANNVRFPFPGLFKGMWVTLKALFTKAPVTMYPQEQEIPVPRARGVISLDVDNCTVCMLCSRECPDWCIYIDSHKEKLPPQKEGGRERTRNALDRFAIDIVRQRLKPIEQIGKRRALGVVRRAILLRGLNEIRVVSNRVTDQRVEDRRLLRRQARPIA